MVVVLPWNLETEITAQLAYTAEWGAELVYPLPDSCTSATCRATETKMEIAK